MKIRIHNLKVRYDLPQIETLEKTLRDLLTEHKTGLVSFEIAKRSVDARKKPVQLVYSVDAVLTGAPGFDIAGALTPPDTHSLKTEPGSATLSCPPVVVGAGPAGLLATLMLAEHGYRPTLIERGGNVNDRVLELNSFTETRTPNPENNVLFGLGGAGTFSDGKLTTSLSHPWIPAILQILVDCGAPKDILIDSKPHIGTDLLRSVVSTLTDRIIKAGGQIKTGVKMTGLKIQNGRAVGILTTQGEMEAGAVVTAIGHSARDTIEMLFGAGVRMEPKPFQVGVRVEHPQSWVDQHQYKDAAGHPNLKAAEYKLTTRIANVPVFSFCMCPGGESIPTVNEPGHLCLNGMSRHARDSKFASSGLVVTLRPEDYGGTDIQSCLNFVRRIEATCYKAAGESYGAPAQRLTNFARNEKLSDSLPPNSYRFGAVPTSIDKVLPKMVTAPIRSALAVFNKKIHGYVHPGAIILAPETRASSSIRILRDKTSRESTSIGNLYPVGEGAGHAGGIISSSLDGILAAKHIIESHARPV